MFKQTNLESAKNRNVFANHVCNTLKSYTTNSRQTCKGGGGFFIKKNIVFTVCSKRTIMQEKILESLFVSFEINGKNAECNVIYRSPSNNPESNEFFLHHLNQWFSNFFMSRRFLNEFLISRRTGVNIKFLETKYCM